MRPRLSSVSTAVRMGFCCDPELREEIIRLSIERNARLSDVIRDLLRKGLEKKNEHPE